MKLRIPIEEVREGDRIVGKRVVIVNGAVAKLEPYRARRSNLFGELIILIGTNLDFGGDSGNDG